MIKNERLVFSMSIAQRIELITSVEMYKSRLLEGYGFPALTLVQDPMRNMGVRATDFPSDTTLACTWDPSVVRNVYKCIGNEAKATVPGAYYSVNNRLGESDASQDPFLMRSFLTEKVRGLNDSGAFVNFEDMAQSEDSVQLHVANRMIADAILQNTSPDSLLIRQSDQANAPAVRDFDGIKCGVAMQKEEVAHYLYNGFSFVFLASDFTEDLIPYLTELTVAYQKAYTAVSHGKMSPEKLDECCRQLTMLPEECINTACDNIIELLIRLKGNDADSVLEQRVPLGVPKAMFNEPLHDATALEAARHSIVMLKNDGTLPLKHEQRVAVLGEYAKDPTYHNNGNRATQEGMPFEVINNYEIVTTGFAYGYRRNETGRSDLWSTAAQLCAESDVALVYLCAENGAKTLPMEQIELLAALSANQTKVVAIVASDGVLDMSFVKMCSAILLTHRGGQKTAHAVFDVVTGFVSPSGKLPYIVYEHLPAEGEDPEGIEIQYPFGFGLSYTTFVYDKLQITDHGASLTVTNNGNYDGYVTVQLYVRKKNKPTDPVLPKYLRGFAKVFLPKGDAAKVEIPFGEETFRTYHEGKKKYCIEGGEYTILVGGNARTVLLQGDVTLASHVFDDESSTSTPEIQSDGERALKVFADTMDKRAFYNRNSVRPIGLRIFLAVMLAVYFDAMIALLFVGNAVPEALLTYIFVGILLAAVNFGVLGYIIATVKKRNRERAFVQPMIGDVVAQLDTFKELSTVSYETPVSPQQFEEDEEKEAEEEQQQEAPQPSYAYDTGFTQITKQDIAFRDNVSFTELCTNFHDYALGWGVEVEPSSVRAFFAALSASKMILVTVRNKEILPLFLAALGGYFQGVQSVDVSPSWTKSADLIWTVESGKYVASAFTNAVCEAERTPDKNAIALLNGVNPATLHGYFNDLLLYALFPSEKHVWTLNESNSVVLPDNIRYVLFTEEGNGDLPADVAEASVQIEMLCSAAAQPGDMVEVKSVSFGAFEDLVSTARENCFLPETFWKKVDELVETFNASEHFAIGNKSLLQLERYTSVLLACGADESETVAAAFTAKLAGLLRTLQIYKKDGGEKTVMGIIEKLFADENLTKIRRAFNKQTL